MEEKTSEFREHMRNAYKSRRKQMKQIIPEGFWIHGKEANKEMLMAFRSLIDEALKRLADEGETGTEKTGKKSKPPINPNAQQ